MLQIEKEPQQTKKKKRRVYFGPNYRCQNKMTRLLVV